MKAFVTDLMIGSISTVLAGGCRHNSCCSSRKQYQWVMSQQEDHKLCTYQTHTHHHMESEPIVTIAPIVEQQRCAPIVSIPRSWSRHDRGATEVRTDRVDSTIVEQQRCVPCRFHDRGATEVRTVPIPRSWRNRGAHRADFTIVDDDASR